jgi:GNAT superfamily N-acetyltransferase
VSRMPIVVRELATSDGPALHSLWAGMLPPPVREVDPADYAEHVLEMVAHEVGATVVVAEVDGQVVGAAYLHRTLVAPVAGAEALQVLMAVEPGRTRRGVGRALVEAATDHAESRGIENVIVVGGPGDREGNRFLARLGLSQVAVLRTAPVAALRARLAPEPATLPGTVRLPRRNRQIGQVVAARRSQQRTRLRPYVR